MTKGNVITVLPPMSDETKGELRRVVRQFDQKMFMACSDTAQGGVNVVRLEIQHPTNTDEVFTSLYERALERAWEQPELFVTDESALAHREIFLTRRRYEPSQLCEEDVIDLTELRQPVELFEPETAGLQDESSESAELVRHSRPR